MFLVSSKSEINPLSSHLSLIFTMPTFPIHFSKSEISSVVIEPIWKWENDEFLVGISTSILGEDDHVLHENSVLID